MSAVRAPDGGGTRPRGGRAPQPPPRATPRGRPHLLKIFAQLGRHVHLPVPGEVADGQQEVGEARLHVLHVREEPDRPGDRSAGFTTGRCAQPATTSGAILLFPPRKIRSAQRRAHNLTQSGLLTPESAQDAPEAGHPGWARCFFISSALTYHYETQCLPTPAAWFAHHLPVWLHKLSVVATFLIEIAVPPLFFAPVRRLRLAAFYSQVLLQVLIVITGNYNFFNLLTLVLATALLDDTHLAATSSTSRRKRTPSSWPKALLAVLALLLELAVYGLLAYGVVHCFGLEVDWEQHVVRSRTTFTFHQFSQWLKMVTLPTMWLGAASLAWELLTALWRWVQVRGSLQKLCAAVPLSVLGTATVALFLISLVPYSYMEPSSHGRLWTGAHRLFGTVEHLQLANSYGLFRRMTGLGGRPEVVLEGSYDGHQWTEIEFMYKPGNLSRPPPIVVPHQPRLDWQMWFAALGPHTHSPWFASLVLRLLQGKAPVIRLIQNHTPSYPFHKQPPTYVRAQRYKYWFSHPWEQGRWWRRQWVEEFFPSVSLGDPALDMLLGQFGLQDKSPPRARGSSNTLSQALHWIRRQLSPLEAPTLLWGLLGAVGAIKVMQALLGPQSLPRSKEEKHKPASQEDSVAASKQASPAPNISSSSQTPRRKKSP
uniref:Lipase maturation factor n=1 Tax=Capra hircus TaxID=9925 RepID=A0A8C2PBI9_CAPHI